ncbi:MAG: GIY-YIG nuclease family protein [Desulfitobacterium sp.]
MPLNSKSMLKEKAKHLPEKPGIYLMKDSLGNNIYVGKAKDLRSRVTQYFRSEKNRDPKVEEMIRHITNFEHRVLDTELDALLEECRAITELKPRYNRQMKNDQNYVYIKIPAETFPKPEIVLERKDDSAFYYGPFNSRSRVETAMLYLKDNFLIRKCTSPGLAKRNSGCLCRQSQGHFSDKNTY